MFLRESILLYLVTIHGLFASCSAPNAEDALSLSQNGTKKSQQNSSNSDGKAAAPAPTTSSQDGASFPDESAVDLLVTQDYQALSPAEKSNVKYLSIASLKSLSPEKLNIVRFGMQKMINCLSQAPDVVLLKPLDSSKSIFKLRLSDYQWTSATWKRMEGDKFADANMKQLSSGATLVQGDWFVYAASRPEIYDRILGLPQLESMLEGSLNINRSSASPKYLGLSQSNVANYGRVLERISIKRGTRDGYYWRSYDWQFKSGSDAAIAKGDPWYAKKRSIPDLIAGEFIWTLPNGLQAYFLSGFGAQHRFDAVLEMAKDNRREDKLVLNGESCFSCHASGLNVRQDEVRPKVLANSGMDQATKTKLLGLYPDNPTMLKQFQADQAVYLEALSQLGYDSIKVDPISATCLIFTTDRGIKDFRQQSGDTDAVFGN